VNARAAALVLALGASGCCRILSFDDSEARDPPPGAPALELGVASFPAGTPPARATTQTWFARKLKPDTYRVGYALEPGEGRAIDDDLQAYAREMNYQRGEGGKFTWRPLKECTGNLRCVFAHLAARNRKDVLPLAERFRKRGRDAKLSTLDLTTLVVTYVQSIPYEIPAQEPFGVLPPALVASRRKGDCDSKSLLCHMLLHELGIDSVMTDSNAHHHTMLGIALPVPGTKFTVGGREYAFTEMTAKGSPIGHINSRLLSPNDWKPAPFAYPDGGTPATKKGR
jgi:hypothetical protein